jgi:hypothetical protein
MSYYARQHDRSTADQAVETTLPIAAPRADVAP